MDDIQPSQARKYPVWILTMREISNDLLLVEAYQKQLISEVIFENVASNYQKKDDSSLLKPVSDVQITTLFKILTGEMGSEQWNIQMGCHN